MFVLPIASPLIFVRYVNIMKELTVLSPKETLYEQETICQTAVHLHFRRPDSLCLTFAADGLLRPLD